MKPRPAIGLVIVTALIFISGGATAQVKDPFTLALTGDSIIM